MKRQIKTSLLWAAPKKVLILEMVRTWTLRFVTRINNQVNLKIAQIMFTKITSKIIYKGLVGQKQPPLYHTFRKMLLLILKIYNNYIANNSRVHETTCVDFVLLQVKDLITLMANNLIFLLPIRIFLRLQPKTMRKYISTSQKIILFCQTYPSPTIFLLFFDKL